MVNAYSGTSRRLPRLGHVIIQLTDYQTNPNIAVVSGFMCAETDEEAWEKADGWTFFQFALQLYGQEGPFEPGEVNFRERYQAWKRAVLNQEITLEDIDTEPFNISRGREPTKPSTKQEKDMVAGVTGRPDSGAIR